ncbi:MAG TPA: S41 family peptidase, partial [Longimicrobiales bacterium]|nr:S41 family peptidase [Longimicrobiales bacterium]
CAAELEWAAGFAARNYAGFETKTAGDAGVEYDRLLAELRPAAAAASTELECNAILGRWVAFFGDGHLSYRRAGRQETASAAPATDDEVRARFADWPVRPMTEAQAREILDGLASGRSPIEGIWQIGDGSYRAAVLRDDDDPARFTMSILRADSVWWLPGQVKARFIPTADETYAVQFFMRDHSEQNWAGRVMRNVLHLDGGSPWFRDWPVEPGDVSPEDYQASRNSRFGVRQLDPNTLLVQLPTFGDAAGVDALFASEGDRIRGTERLVLDLRGNGGGSDYNFRALIPLIYSGPIRMVSNAALATDDNIRANELLAADTTLPAGIRVQLAGSVARMRTALGGWYEFDDRVIDDLEPMPLPRTVAVVVDRGCASSCEQFLLAARQSSKVTIYGTRTAGILDFGNVRTGRMPGGTLVLNYPTTRSKRLPDAPVDGTGILPDVEIPDGEQDAPAWVLRHLP